MGQATSTEKFFFVFCFLLLLLGFFFSPLFRGKERGHTHSEAMLSSLVHAFHQSSEKTLRRDTSVWITTPRHNSSLVPISSLFHLCFLSAVYFLFTTAHPAHAVFVLPLPVFVLLSPPPPFSHVYSWSHLPLPSHGLVSFVRPLLCLQFPPFSTSLISSASLFVYDSDELEGKASPPPFLWTCSCET